ncbi:hypothetical protein GOEFS_051_00080 [Gordonia effusa NBRC 100432]|uniref:Lipoprotein n=2 Tax=Gordonia effusa TaxID=263908 RepID=H0QZR2_9ACTN|nr:hypothetical protein GOEFS_051_00080 [Gordonia effusa NBRC 100432]
MRKVIALTAMLCALPTGLVACSAAADAVDPAALDTGHYSTVARPDPGPAQSIVTLESQRLADFVLCPWEIDPLLTDMKMPTYPVRLALEAKEALGGNAYKKINQNTFLYGYVATAAEPVMPKTTPHKSMVHMALRFTDAAAATQAARSIYTYELNGDEYMAKGAAAKLENQSSLALTALTSGGKARKLAAITTHNDFVIFTRVTTPVGNDQSWLTDTVNKATTNQLRLIGQFQGRPPNATANGIPRPQLDSHKMMRYTLPANESSVNEIGGASVNGVFGLRGITHTQTNPQASYRALSAAGSTLNAVGDNIVLYRADNPDKAETLRKTFITEGTATNGLTPMAGPPGLAPATCLYRDTYDGRLMVCYVQVGRYMAEISGSDDQTDLWRKTSAQYLILTHADQNAH